MTKKNLALTFVLTALFCFPLYLLSEETGAPVRNTGGNFPGEGSCANADCHGGVANSQGGSVTVAVNGSPLSEYRYTPGETVPVTVTIADPNPDQQRWGFQITARTASSGGCEQAGSFDTINEDPMVQIGFDSTPVPTCPPATIQFPTHTFPKFGPGSGSFDFMWTAPSADIGAILFAAAGNAANGNVGGGFGNTGDNIYTTQATVPAAELGEPPAPSIDGGGVGLATGTPAVTQGVPSAIITVFGQDFAPAGTSALAPQLDGDDRLLTNLADTCVEVNGVRSPMFAVVPAQVNAQAPGPDQVGLGPASVVVVRGCSTANEQRSDPEPLVLADAAPAFFKFANTLEGTDPIAATHLSGALVGDPSLGAAFTPAEPGEYISLYGTGFGATDPPVPAGAIPLFFLPEGLNGAASVPPGSASLTIGGLPPDDLAYVGVSPCCAGLYQVVAKVPANAPDGDQQVVLTINGVASPVGPFITVRKP